MQPFNRLLLTLGLASPLYGAVTLTPVSTDHVGTIEFEGDCAKPHWSAAPDGTISLMMSGVDGGECSATILFDAPIRLGEKPGLSFEVKGSEAKQTYAIEVPLSQSGSRWQRTRPYPAPLKWQKDGLDFLRWKPTRGLLKLSGIRFVAVSNRPRTAPMLYVRGIHLSDNPAAPAPQAKAAPLAPAIENAPVEASPTRRNAEEPMVLQMDEPALPEFEEKPLLPALTEVERSATRKGWVVGLRTFAFFVALAAGGWLLVLAWRGLRRWTAERRRTPKPVKSPRTHEARQMISPLYELNTRTWNTYRDGENVIHLGGFKSISQPELLKWRADGFEALWLMGIWEVGPKVRHISRRYAPDYKGSPYAIHDYRVAADLGTPEEFDALVARSRKAGLRVIVDFVPNHMGLDCVWLNSNPEFFIHKGVPPDDVGLSDAELEKKHEGYFVHHTPSYPQNGRRVSKTILVAYGKDPYFYPWIDTAQLDYARADVRQKMTDILCGMARQVDGVRCDMAMLVLREQIRNHRHPEMSDSQFQEAMPKEFWTDAIQEAKKVNPNFVFIAETYWALEGYLQQIGFDYTYNKPLYEAVCSAFHSGHAEGLMNFLRLLGTDYLKRSVHFLENHDEERAMNALGHERQRAAAALIGTLPGALLIHQGQMEGRRERLPVQRVLPLTTEPEDVELRQFYGRLLQSVQRPVFKHGEMHVLFSNNPSLVAYARQTNDELALIIVNTSAHLEKGSIYLTPHVRLDSSGDLHLLDLFYDLKKPSIQQQLSVQPVYLYRASRILNDGLYVELQPHDAHVFLAEKTKTGSSSMRIFRRSLRANTKPSNVSVPV